MVEGLFGLAPEVRIWVGVGCIAAGAFTTWWLWEAGWIWSLPLLLGVGGAALLFAGIGDVRREKAIREEWRRAQAQEDQIVRMLVDLKRQGKRPSTWLLQQGYRDFHVRQYLMEQMREQMDA